jgi:hypothetical protein
VTTSPIAFLRSLGADQIPHSGKTLLAHLVNTAAICKRWGCDEDTQAAALFHSIYGTEFFKAAPLTISPTNSVRVGEVIGEGAEAIACAFCIMDRRSVYDFDTGDSINGTYRLKRPDGSSFRVFDDIFASLVQILWANAMEQGPCKDRVRSRVSLEKCAPFLPTQALRELRAYTASSQVLLNSGPLYDVLMGNWPDESFSTGGPVTRLGGLVDFTFDELCAMPRRFTKAFTPQGKHIWIKQGEERAHYDAGNTVYWHSLKSPTMDMWVRALTQDLGLLPGATRISAFASRHGAGVPTHYDPNDNFVCQAKGLKRWRVSKTRVPYPTVGATLSIKPNRVVAAEAGEFPTEMPDFTVVEMQPGDVMFMPRGLWHDTVTTEEESLHFNVQCGLATWKDAVDYVLATSLRLHSGELRAPIETAHIGSDMFMETLENTLEITLQDIADGVVEFDAEEFRKFVAKRRDV